MGAYNRFLADYRCPRCEQVVERAYQFKHGDCWQYDYRAGDVLAWGGNEHGTRQAGRVEIDCVPEACANCGWDEDAEYSLIIEDDALRAVVGPIRVFEPPPLDGAGAPDTEILEWYVAELRRRLEGEPLPLWETLHLLGTGWRNVDRARTRLISFAAVRALVRRGQARLVRMRSGEPEAHAVLTFEALVPRDWQLFPDDDPRYVALARPERRG